MRVASKKTPGVGDGMREESCGLTEIRRTGVGKLEWVHWGRGTETGEPGRVIRGGYIVKLICRIFPNTKNFHYFLYCIRLFFT